MRLYILNFLFLFGCIAPPESKWPELEVINTIKLRIDEPSDICLASDQQSFYIVSDQGVLYQTDFKGNNLKKVSKYGSDYEGVWYQEPYINVVDETRMEITLFDPVSFEKITSHNYDITTRLNKGWESITYNPLRKHFVLFSEKKPVNVYEMNNEYRITREEEIKEFKEVSACTWFNNKLWVLSDEKQEVYRVNPETYKIETGWFIAVNQPEGICFSKEGMMYIVSDSQARLYIFETPKESKEPKKPKSD